MTLQGQIEQASSADELLKLFVLTFANVEGEKHGEQQIHLFMIWIRAVTLMFPEYMQTAKFTSMITRMTDTEK